MDSADYNQFSIPADELEDQSPYMVENMEGVDSLVVNDEVIGIEIPDAVDLPIADTAPGVRGNSATGRTKAATLSTGRDRAGPRAHGAGHDGAGRHPDGRISRPGELGNLGVVRYGEERSAGARIAAASSTLAMTA